MSDEWCDELHAPMEDGKQVMASGEVLIRRQGRIGRVTLNRPRALNALTLPMLHDIGTALRQWQDEPDVHLVVLDGAGDRGFCAGGDIRFVHASARARDRRARDLWAAEFLLDAYIHGYPKPVVSLVDGITMGGGVGLGCHRPVRVATERSQFAMPEVRLGFSPDVAGTWLLGRTPGRIGEHLVLTGERITAGDAVACGLADHIVPADRLQTLVRRLQRCDMASALAELEVAPEPAPLLADREWIDYCYAPCDVEEIVTRLLSHGHPRAAAAAEQIRASAPLAVKVALRALRQAREAPSMYEVLERDYRLMCRFLERPDLVEGIHATAIEKSATPRWSPASLHEVDEQTVAAFFAPMPDGEELRHQMPSWSR